MIDWASLAIATKFSNPNDRTNPASRSLVSRLRPDREIDSPEVTVPVDDYGQA